MAMIDVDSYNAGKNLPLTLRQLDQWRWEAIQVPNWRMDAQIDEDYYDSNQMDAQTLKDMEDRGIPPVVVNLIGPTIDLVLGLEVMTRSDWIVRPDSEQWDEVSIALSHKMKQAKVAAGVDMACSSAYEDEVQAGIGWVEVARESDPFRYPHRVKRCNWREFWWDVHGENLDLSDWRFLMRRRFFDRDLLKLYFPKKADDIDAVGTGALSTIRYDGRGFVEPSPLFKDATSGRDWSITELNWTNTWGSRNRVALEEIWYRVYMRGDVLRLPDGRAVEFDKKNPVHVAAVNSGKVTLQESVYTKMRLAYWIGPLQLWDQPTPYRHHKYPYVPFFGHREKRTQVPYGLIRRMRPLQDEVNARRSKMLWGLSAKRVMADDDAVEDHDAAREEIARPDAYIIKNSQRRPTSDIKVEENFAMNKEQFEVYVDSKKTLQDAAGVYQTMLGKQETSVTSGVAMNTLVQQGMTTLAKINENYRRARTMVGELLLSLNIEDLSKEENLQIVAETPAGRRQVSLNIPTEIGGATVYDNDVERAQLNVVLDDRPATATFRQQQYLQLTELVRNLPPEFQSIILDLVIESSDLPERHKIAERIRAMSGVGADPAKMTPEQQQAFAEQQRQKQEAAELAKRGMTAKVTGDEQKAQEVHARTGKIMAETEQIIEQTAVEKAGALKGGPVEQKAVYRW